MAIDNKFIDLIYNKLDFPIRFLYCRLPLLSRLLFWKLYSSNFEKLDKNFKEMKKIIEKSGFSFERKVCLELGPGNSYINAYNLLMNGAKKVTLVDKFPRYIKTKKQKEFFNKELSYIKQKYNQQDLFFVKNGKIDKNYIEFIKGDFAIINFKEKIDFALTISVFEHIKNIEQVIAKLTKVIKKGGLIYHSINLRDHYNFNNPFLFYKYSKKTWEKYLTKEGVSYTNRLRYRDFMKLFKKYGFKVLNEDTERFAVNIKKINRKFQNQDNLDVGVLRIVLQK